MPRLLGTMARTAVIAGTATHVSNNVSRRQSNRWAQKQDAEAYQEQAQQPPQQVVYAAPPPAPADSDDMIEKLQKLGALRDQGILTDAEFDAQKAKVLAGL
jgi:Short C-terminal domain